LLEELQITEIAQQLGQSTCRDRAGPGQQSEIYSP
jgi:hypothetical protein